jgi:hypothetical protein
MMSSLYATEKGDWFTLDWYKKMRRTSDNLKYRADPIDVARIANARLEAAIAKQRIVYVKLKRSVNGTSALFDARVLEKIKVSSREVQSIEDKTEQSTKSKAKLRDMLRVLANKLNKLPDLLRAKQFVTTKFLGRDADMLGVRTDYLSDEGLRVTNVSGSGVIQARVDKHSSIQALKQ